MPRPKIAYVSAEELQARIDDYFAAVESGEIKRVGWAHFASHIGVTLESIKTMLAATEGSQYIKHRDALKRALTKLRGIMETSDSFAGSNSSKSIFLLKQDIDGCAYQDKTGSDGAPINVKIEFGGSKSSFR